jgi:hypothetical protein
MHDELGMKWKEVVVVYLSICGRTEDKHENNQDN